MKTISSLPLKVADTGNDVANLHQMLKTLGYEIDADEKKNKQFGETTATAVRDFQVFHGLKQTGEVDDKTYEHLKNIARGLKTRPGTKAKPAARKTIAPKAVTNGPSPNGPQVGNGFRKILVDHVKSQVKAYSLEGLSGKITPKIEKLINELPPDIVASADDSVADVMTKFVLPALSKEKTLLAEYEKLKEKVTNEPGGTIKDLLHLDVPEKENPLLVNELTTRKIERYAKMISLPNEKAKAIARENISWNNLSEVDLDLLVSKNLITEKQKDPLLRMVELGKLTGDNDDLVSAIEAQNIKSVSDLVTLEKEDWIKMISDNKVKVPEGEDVEAYADNIVFNIENTFATPFILNRLAKPKLPEAIKDLKWLNAVPNEAWTPAGGIDPELDLTSSNGNGQHNGAFKEASDFINTYKYLGVGEVLKNKELSLNDKKDILEKRVGSMQAFIENNPDLDLTATDLVTEASFLNWTGIPKEEEDYIRKQLMASQRVARFGTRPQTGLTLLKKGFDSAMRITDLDEEDFVKKSGLSRKEAKYTYKKAQDETSASMHAFEAIRDLVKGNFKDLAVANASPTFPNDLKQIDGYTELFGSQDFCDCDHCKSIFSPAAYFTDLMYFVESKVSKKVFIPNKLQHPLYLKNRRPDLWTLQLTCENTNTEIPYLQLVNEVLEFYLKNQLGIQDVYNTLHTSQISCFLPFDLPLAEIRTYLSHFDLTLYDIYKALNEPKEKIWREKIQMSDAELKIVLTDDQNAVVNRFGQLPLADFPVEDFLSFSGLTRGELDELLAVKFIQEIANVTVEKKAVSNDIQPFKEVMKGLNKLRLDLMHRYTRLWRKTGWRIRELDLVLMSLKSAGLLNQLDDKDAANNNFPKVLQVAMLRNLQTQLGFTVEELCGLSGHIPGSLLAGNAPSFQERLFDMASLFGVTATLPDGKKTYSNTFVIPANKTQDTKTALVLAGLSISEQDLTLLLKKLGQDITNDITVNVALLSRLYAHARIATALKVTVPELIAFIDLFLNGSAISRIEQYNELMDAVSWVKSSSLTISELNFIVKGVENEIVLSKYNRDVIAGFVNDIQKLQPANPVNELKQILAREFNITGDQTDDLLVMVATDINSGAVGTGLATAFNNNGQPVAPAELDGIVQLFIEAERTMLLINELELTAEAHKFLVAHPGVFGIANPKAINATHIKQILSYSKLLKLDTEKTEVINLALNDYTQLTGFNTAGIELLASLWKQPQALVQSVMDNITKPGQALLAAHTFQHILSLCAKLGINGETFKKFSSITYAGLRAGRDIALGSFASQYVDEKTRHEKLEPYNDRINTLKRDALCHYIIARRDKFKFSNRNELYAFFLLDVEMSGCFRTSRVVQATGSVQLYIHRCLLNLEQSDAHLNPAIENIAVKPTWIPLDEWEWRKNYRVWEANRKVFVFPESYIEPTLRLNKTHIFKELEEELLQEKITAASAETAYKKYMAGFTELANLQYAGSYLHKKPLEEDWYDMVETDDTKMSRKEGTYQDSTAGQQTEDIYYFFARTNTSPYQYYYRTLSMQKKLWGNWEKIDLGIEAKEVSSIIFNGRLYLFWTEVQNKEVSNIKGGNAASSGYVFKVFAKYSFLNENNKWAPAQRLYVGHTFTGESQLFDRVWNNPPAPDDRDKKKDYTLEQYQEKIFRKPYVIKNSSLYNPIALNYIWTKDKGVTTVNYSVSSMTVTMDLMLGIKLNFYIPGTSFQITGNDFSNAVTDIKIYVTATFAGEVQDDAEIDGKIQLQNSGNCVVTYSFLGEWAFGMSVTSQTLPQHTKASQNLFSMSKNIIADTTVYPLDNSFSNITSSPYTFLKQEYDKGYLENGDFVHYVETGDKTFSDTTGIVTQYKTGDAHLQISETNKVTYIKLSTILTDELAATLFAKSMEEFLSLQTQQMIDPYSRQLDFKGAYGEYYWEMFFHIPFLIANHLNANNKFKEAKWWYERIFNPTAEETPADIKPYDHNWRYREFRNLNLPKLKEMLSDEAAIALYHKDPFNPHAIARLRISAYQKAIVMKYIDNLLDWGDYLFTQDSRESINEAMQLYVLANDILGKRPAKVGKCSSAKPEDLTYQKIGPKIDADSEFLIVLENWVTVNRTQQEKDMVTVKNIKSILAEISKLSKSPKVKEDLNELAEVAHYTSIREKFADKAQALKNKVVLPGNGPKASAKYGGRVKAYQDVAVMRKNSMTAEYKPKEKPKQNGKALNVKEKVTPVKHRPHKVQVKQSVLAFCVPNNTEMLKYWDRVEDRQYKIRNCMNISGVRRSLSLFQPPIDPMLLVRARAAGLSLDDVLAQIGGQSLPPYRFVYLIEKARQMAQLVQSFGTSLLSALEKKDTEELTLLRSVHERNILKLGKDVKKKELQEAQNQYKAMTEAKIGVQKRIDYYQGLIDTGLVEWEVTQQVATHLASGFESAAALQKLLGGILYLIPQLGSPFAMKYGGSELGNSAQAFGEMTRSLASIAHAVAASAGLEATYQRREQDWKFQLQSAQQEMKQSVLQELAAELRQAIAEKQLSIHETTIEQADEVHDYYKNKFSNLGLYQFLSSRLNRVYREAYNLAYDLAKMAERAFQYERNSSTTFIAADNWQYDRAGLMAGESLSLQLQKLEQAFMNSNTRTPEITQSFSLALLDPYKLLQLQQTGSCTFKIPEIAFEALYPGQYNRQIKAVRLTMPCVVGSYTNVSAKLTLLKGEIEKTDKAALVEELLGKNTSVTMSSANSDSGMFDFNFKDERYLPFEGAGAISEWRLELPAAFRAFDYRSISDVILQISYSALDGNRTDAENALAANILAFATNPGLFRIISLKHEFPDAFHRLLNPAQGQPNTTQFETLPQHFPYALQNSTLAISEVKVFLNPKKGQVVNTMGLTFNTNKPVTWAAGEDIDYPGAVNNKNKIKGGTVAGINDSPVNKNWTLAATVADPIDGTKLEDIMVLIKYRVV